MKKAVIFDIDGTLFDHPGAERTGLDSIFSAYQGFTNKPPFEDFVNIWHFEAETYLQQYNAGQISYEQQRVRRVQSVFARWGEMPSETLADEMFENYLKTYEANWRLYDDAIPCLDKLAGMPLAIISNGDSETQREKLRRTGIIDRFNPVIISGDIGIGKPHREIFYRAVRDLELPPDDIIYVGDNLHVDAIGAVRAGLVGVWVNRGRKRSAPEGVITISSLAQLVPIAKKSWGMWQIKRAFGRFIGRKNL